MDRKNQNFFSQSKNQEQRNKKSSLKQNTFNNQFARHTMQPGVPSNKLFQGTQKQAVGDKQFQHKLIEEIYEFIQNNEQNGEKSNITIQQLQDPQTKYFLNIFNYLMRCYDQNIMQDNTVTIEQIPVIIKFLGYKANLNKSMFITLGAPHTYGYVLQMLKWMIDQIQYIQKKQVYDEERQEEEFKNNDIQSLIDQHVLSQIQGDLTQEEIEENEKSLQDKIEDTKQKTLQEIKETEDKIQSYELAQQNLQKQQPELEVIQQQIQKQKDQNFGKNQIFQKIMSEYQDLDQKQIKENQVLQTLQNNIQEIQNEIEKIENTIKSQIFDTGKEQILVQEIQNTINQKINLQNQIQNLNTHKNGQIKQINQSSQEIKKYINQYNQTLLQDLKLENHSKYLLNQVNYEIFDYLELPDSSIYKAYKNNDFNSVMDTFFNRSLSNDIIPFLKQEKQIQQEEYNQQYKQLEDITQKNNVYQDNLEDKNKELNHLQQQVQSKLQIIEQKRQNLSKHKQNYELEFQKIEREYNNLALQKCSVNQELDNLELEIQSEIDQSEKIQLMVQQVDIEVSEQREDMFQKQMFNKRNTLDVLRTLCDDYQEMNRVIDETFMQELGQEDEEQQNNQINMNLINNNYENLMKNDENYENNNENNVNINKNNNNNNDQTIYTPNKKQ